MRRPLLVLLTAAALLTGAGCPSDQEKGINSNRDRPMAAPVQKATGDAGSPRAPAK
jgi:hypothetical protein